MGQLVDGLSRDQLLAIPASHRNNILWNLGHVVVTQQRLHYRLSGLDMYVTTETEEAFRTGTSPSDWTNTPDVERIRRLLDELPERLRVDLDARRFGGFRQYTTSTGIVLRSIEDALVFNHYHEGVHMGVMLSLRKLVG